MAVPPESVSVSDTDTDRLNGLIGAKVMTIVSLAINIVCPEQITIVSSEPVSISPGHTP